MPEEKQIETIHFHPLTPDLWEKFETLFGPRGACAGCWCMWWKMRKKEFEQNKGEVNRQLMKKRVESGEIPGIIALKDNVPIGWCAVEPREKYPRLSNSRILQPVDNQPVWSVTCFFIKKNERHKGLTVKLLKATIDFVRHNGGTIVEGYPVEPKKDKTADAFVYTGLASAFRKAGFTECTRRSETRPIMRYVIT